MKDNHLLSSVNNISKLTNKKPKGPSLKIVSSTFTPLQEKFIFVSQINKIQRLLNTGANTGCFLKNTIYTE